MLLTVRWGSKRMGPIEADVWIRRHVPSSLFLAGASRTHDEPGVSPCHLGASTLRSHTQPNKQHVANKKGRWQGVSPFPFSSVPIVQRRCVWPSAFALSPTPSSKEHSGQDCVHHAYGRERQARIHDPVVGPMYRVRTILQYPTSRVHRGTAREAVA